MHHIFTNIQIKGKETWNWGYLLLLFNAWAMKAKRALGHILFISLLPLSKAKRKGGEPFGLAEVQLWVAEFFALRGGESDGGIESEGENRNVLLWQIVYVVITYWWGNFISVSNYIRGRLGRNCTLVIVNNIIEQVLWVILEKVSAKYLRFRLASHQPKASVFDILEWDPTINYLSPESLQSIKHPEHNQINKSWGVKQTHSTTNFYRVYTLFMRKSLLSIPVKHYVNCTNIPNIPNNV